MDAGTIAYPSLSYEPLKLVNWMCVEDPFVQIR